MGLEGKVGGLEELEETLEVVTMVELTEWEDTMEEAWAATREAAVARAAGAMVVQRVVQVVGAKMAEV